MKILITNDDGINAKGLDTLVNWAKKLGDITVAAPKVQQSAKSCSIQLNKSFEVIQVEKWPGVTTYQVDSTPTDCVRYSVANISKDFDLVLSGINNGYNIGLDIIYSGTCGACFEASTWNINSIAFSTDYDVYDISEESLDEAYNLIIDRNLFEYSKIFNVNIVKDSRGLLFTRQGGPFYRDTFIHEGNDQYKASGFIAYKGGNNLTCDLDSIHNGFSSISPLTIDRTDLEAYHKIKEIL